jgi:preprotein translocase subunit YajC
MTWIIVSLFLIAILFCLGLYFIVIRDHIRRESGARSKAFRTWRTTTASR